MVSNNPEPNRRPEDTEYYNKIKARLEYNPYLDDFKSETLTAVKYFDREDKDLDSAPQFPEALEKTLRSFEAWCRNEHHKAGPVKEPVKEIETPLLAERALYDFDRNLSELTRSIARLSQLHVASVPNVIKAYEYVVKGQRVEACLVELKNKDGMYLTFDGISLELVASGPAFSVVTSDYTQGEPKASFILYSKEAFEDRLLSLFNPYSPKIRGSLDLFSLPSLIEEARMVLEDKCYNDQSKVYIPPEDVYYQPTSSGTIIFSTDLGEHEVKIGLNKFGTVDVRITGVS